ncbi:MAG: hypothetical protein K6G83_08340 [Lachnospiraceae bacterium]|nr:hypothetical protein [Lachnospiraceae bacterium]
MNMVNYLDWCNDFLPEETWYGHLHAGESREVPVKNGPGWLPDGPELDKDLQKVKENGAAFRVAALRFRNKELQNPDGLIWYFGKPDPCADRYNLQEIDWDTVFENEPERVVYLYRVSPLIMAVLTKDRRMVWNMLRQDRSLSISRYHFCYDEIHYSANRDDVVQPYVSLHEQLTEACASYIRICRALLTGNMTPDLFAELLCRLEEGASGDGRWFFWPFAYQDADPETFRNSLNLLLSIKEQWPQIFGKIYNEKLHGEILFSFFWNFCHPEAPPARLYAWFIKKMHELSTQRTTGDFFYRLVDQALGVPELELNLLGDGRVEQFWKDLTGKEPVLDLRDRKNGEWFYRLFEEFEASRPFESGKISRRCVQYLRYVLRSVTRVIPCDEDEERLEIPKDLLLCKDAELLLLALQKNLLSVRQVDNLIRIARENGQTTEIPLLILKKHGEWKEGEVVHDQQI